MVFRKNASQHTVLIFLADVKRFIEFAELQCVGEVIF